MSKHFIKNIEIKNFKCFEDFKAEGFGRVNLIGGKNNVGKTAFMEAVYVNIYAQTVESFHHAITEIKHFRDILDILYSKNIGKEYNNKEALEFSNNMYTSSNINKTLFYIKEKNGIKEYIFNFLTINAKVNVKDFSFELEYIESIRFISNFGLNKNDLKHAFIAVQIRDKEDVVYKYINEFDNDILNFKIIGGDIPQCKTTEGIYRDLNEFGDGLKHFISIICSLYECSNGYLFIDEIDNGVHYTKLDLLWKIILTISKEQSVQVFATTHSKECIESYIRVAKELEDKDIDYSIITKLKSGKLHHSLYSYDLLENAVIEQEHEVRGW